MIVICSVHSSGPLWVHGPAFGNGRSACDALCETQQSLSRINPDPRGSRANRMKVRRVFCFFSETVDVDGAVLQWMADAPFMPSECGVKSKCTACCFKKDRNGTKTVGLGLKRMTVTSMSPVTSGDLR